MKSDRELMELAAKSVGYSIKWVTMPRGEDHPFINLRGILVGWLPLTDDADALRLAFALGMSVDTKSCIIDFCIPDADDEEMESQETLEFDNLDGDIANLRRAIVRAAAAIGEAMP